MNKEQEIAEKLQKHRAEKPTDTVESKTKTFSKEELEKIGLIKETYDNITLRMGQIVFELKNLNQEESDLHAHFEKTRKDEVDFAQELNDKYGKGTLDISTGIFTPVE